ncbi:hypothetical protein Syun_024303 [Stephania yunnanensis]|uniref:Uncharacterized protein n=1 Tax=Stephania yunnanensis TaxID=152371 RepID=A0AAP0NHF8_9MAGN
MYQGASTTTSSSASAGKGAGACSCRTRPRRVSTARRGFHDEPRKDGDWRLPLIWNASTSLLVGV